MADNAPLQFPIERGLLLSILTDAIEYSARAFWAQIDHYPDLDAVEKRLEDPLKGVEDDEVLVRVRDDEDGMARAEDRPMVDVTLATLEAATQWAITNYSHLLPFHVSDNMVDDIDYDASGADVILQKVVLDEVVYG